MTKNLHVCTICFRPKVVYDVISGRNVKTIEGYPVVNFEVASSSCFGDILKKIISWRRRRTSTIALSENAFTFRLKKTELKPITFLELNRLLQGCRQRSNLGETKPKILWEGGHAPRRFYVHGRLAPYKDLWLDWKTVSLYIDYEISLDLDTSTNKLQENDTARQWKRIAKQ